MKILMASSEAKTEGGNLIKFQRNNFFLKNLFPSRIEALKLYIDFINDLNIEELSRWVGLKNLTKVGEYKKSVLEKPVEKAVLKYSGVAFGALEYKTLEDSEQLYVDSNVIIFSKLFGPIKADDLIPDYKFKQTSEILNFNIVSHYKTNFSSKLDEYLDNEILDLRPTYFQKFYKPKDAKVLTIKFLKNGKIVSHWAKFYRGVFVRYLAKNEIRSFKEISKMIIPNLTLISKEEDNSLIIYTYNIIS